jgi:tRNA(Ile2) C34 agmatinyltransferase TiaS
MVKAKVESLYIKSTCQQCGRETISKGDSIVMCACGLSYRVDASVKITTSVILNNEKGVLDVAASNG